MINVDNIVIGIEGLVGSGKTSMCRELLNEIPNSIVFHGGNLYRGIIYAVMNSNEELGNNMQNLKQMMQDVDIKKIMDMLKVEFKVENRETVVYVNGKKIEENLENETIKKLLEDSVISKEEKVLTAQKAPAKTERLWNASVSFFS